MEQLQYLKQTRAMLRKDQLSAVEKESSETARWINDQIKYALFIQPCRIQEKATKSSFNEALNYLHKIKTANVSIVYRRFKLHQ